MQSQAARRLRATEQTHARTSRYTPRAMRPKLWFDVAYQAAKANGASAVEAAKIALSTANGRRARINDRKIAAEGLLRRTADQARMHYGEIAQGLPSSLDAALVEINRALRAELAHLDTLAPYTHGSRHHGTCLNRIDRLQAARLVLRLIRFIGQSDAYPEIREAIAAPIPLVEAFQAFHQLVRPGRGR